MNSESGQNNFIITFWPSTLLGIAALATLIPSSTASSGNLFGYMSMCPNAPISTLACAFFAWFFYMRRARK
ncbi:hypothetical protein HUU42_01780 [bacterium]|nr:hypothetical protein [bacterium]